ncbi:branched-chain amino acid ABC transporter permease [Natronosalvus halobius]|uniref:branched-chain amino acid ABC transporter permease n=1 Tax=Natronosalvus halobius TaxID=2953746 RepID=UPI00209FA974|nr:branched-chain amino acid ABC transporter permease [Natronosalvus halobius]USZ73580.1 branched-chain amino acid ABC transporter permease [Natronosalvus halobius]
MADAATIIQAALTGLMQGGVYALISIGLTIIFGVLGIINFAQADFMMLGMYVALTLFLSLAISPILLFFLLLPVFIVFGAVIQRGLIEPIIDEQEDAQLILTFGILLILQNGMLAIFGSSPQTISVPYSSSAFRIGWITLNQAKAIAFVFAITTAFAIFLLLRYTEFGRAIRATADNTTAAGYAGINVQWVYMVAFGLGIALTASAGALLVMYFPASPTVGFDFIVLMFVVVVAGGLGSVKGALIAGLVIGVIESLSVVWLPLELQPATIFVMFLLVVLLRPQGLFGTAERGV